MIFLFIIFFLPFCLSCPEGYYISSPTSCSKCHDLCKTCVGPSFQKCSSCYNPYFMDIDARLCNICPSGCYSCSLDICNSCVNGHYLSNDRCFPCAQGCKTCIGSSLGECLSCNVGFLYDLSSKSCQAIVQSERCQNINGCDICSAEICRQCSPGFYLSENKTQCLFCDKSCGNCEGPLPNQCLDCNLGGKLSSSSCSYNCSQASCEKCNGSEFKDCVECDSPYFLSNGICSLPGCTSTCKECELTSGSISDYNCKTCINGYYLNNGVCSSCHSNCSQCTSSTFCVSCQMGFYLASGSCLDCEKGCMNCESASTCSKCFDGFYAENNKCLDCSPVCKECSGPNKDQCISCHDNQILNGTKCLYIAVQGEDGLIILGMQLLIAAGSAIIFFSCVITIIYKCIKKDEFFIELEKQVKYNSWHNENNDNNGIIELNFQSPDQSHLQPANKNLEFFTEKKDRHEKETISEKKVDSNQKNEVKVKEKENENEKEKEKDKEKREGEEEEEEKTLEEDKKYELEIIDESVDENEGKNSSLHK